MNRLRRLLAGTRTPVARKRSVNAAVRWLMWDPSRAQTALLSVAAVALLAVGAFAFRGAMWVQTSQYDAQVAAVRASQTPQATTLPEYPMASQTATATPLPVAPLAPVADVEKAPQDAARAFLAAWTAAPRMTSQTAWLDALRPHTAPSLLALFTSTNRATVPIASVTAMTSVTVPELHTSHVSAQMGGIGTVGLVLEDTSGHWLVTDVSPEQ